METKTKIPLFPLTIFPLPGELVPLHIFESKYRQLLYDAESKDISFGIYFNHVSNTEKWGSLVKLESVIKRFPSGESDIIVKCTDSFILSTMYRSFRDKMYPGAEVTYCNVDLDASVNGKLLAQFAEYLSLLKIFRHPVVCSVYHIANELNLDLDDRLMFVRLADDRKESFISGRLGYQKQLVQAADKAKDVYHLN